MGWAEKYPDGRVVDYDPAWPEKYLDIHRLLTAALGPDWAIEHAGSTSVPGLCAKPVIDVVLRLPDPWEIATATGPLTYAGWTVPIVVGDHWATFFPRAGPRAAIGHIFNAEQCKQLMCVCSPAGCAATPKTGSGTRTSSRG